PADEWILWKLETIIYEVTKDIEEYKFSLAGEKLRDFTWNILADWYLEIAKVEGDKSQLLNYILNTLLKLWHPFMPFVTEAVWQEVYGDSQMLIVQKYPIPNKNKKFDQAVEFFDNEIREIIYWIRSAKKEQSIPQKKIIDVKMEIDKRLENF